MLDNLACFCDVHHHAVHDRGWTITGNANGRLVFTSPRGRIATETAPIITLTKEWKLAYQQRHTDRNITEKTIATATNEPCDLHWIVGNICDTEHVRRNRREQNKPNGEQRDGNEAA